jgi:hypothetical protein
MIDSLAQLLRFAWSFRPWGPTPDGQPLALLERLGRLLLIIWLLAGFPIAVNRAIQNAGGSDFPAFYAAGQYVLQHAARSPDTNMANYLPSVDVFWGALTGLPLPIAACLWYVAGCLAWFGLLRAIGIYLLSEVTEPTRRTATLTAGLLLLPLAIDGLCVGTFHLFMVWLMVAGLGRVSRNRCWSGGILLGLAVWVKLLPALGIAYLLLKRKWLPAAVAVACVVAVDLGLTLIAFGPRTAWDTHVKWFDDAAVGTVDRQLTAVRRIDEDRLTNQSVAVTLRRLLTGLGIKPSSPLPQVAVADLSPAQLETTYLVMMGLLTLAVCVICQRPGRELSPSQWANEIALISLATLWFSPVVWSYHPTAAVPAVAIIFSRGSSYRRLAWTTTLLWLAAMTLLAWPVARACGDLLWGSLITGSVLIWVCRPDSTTQQQVPADCEDVRPLPLRRQQAA